MHARFDLTDMLMRSAVWAFVGVIFAFIFVVLYQFTADLAHPFLRYPVATTAAGAIGALIYGSMRLTVIVACFAFVAVIGYLLFAPTPNGSGVLLAGAAIGAVVGAVYAAKIRGSHIGRADAKILAGATAGLAAALLVIAIESLAGPLAYPVLTGILCPVTGLVYIRLAPWFVERFSRLLPTVGDGAVVGSGVGVAVGMLFLIMAGSVDNPLAADHGAVVRGTLAILGPATAGAAIGAFVAAIGRSLLGAKWYDL